MRRMIELGLFDILQIDPTDASDHATVYQRRLEDLALADELGLSVAFTAERHFLAHFRCPAPGVWLGAASQRTRRMRLGVLAYTLPLHSPVLLAEEIAVLDHISGGRLEVGVGLGHRPEELAALGIDPAQRIPMFQQRLAIMQALWTGGQVSIESPHDTIRDVAVTPLPLQVPHPPVWYAGTNPAAAGWAGGFGLNLAVGFAPTPALQPATATFSAGRTKRRSQPQDGPQAPGGRIALMRHVFVADNDQRARTEMIDALVRLEEWQRPAGEGSRPDRRAAAAEEADRLMREEVYLAGGPETVARSIFAARQALGIDLFLANIYAPAVDPERIRQMLRLLASPVRECLRSLSEHESAAVAQ
ncbi:MAG: hypothetical protein C4346_08680 [Chloroflexota bacterium]